MTKTNTRENGQHTRMLCLSAVFTALIAVGAFLKIPIPYVPFTMQYFFTMLSGLLLGKKYGTASVAVYVLLGLMGVPIFAEGGGIYYLFKPSFGYLLGFILGTYVTARLVEEREVLTKKRIFLANFVGLLIVYALGMLYYFLIANYWVGGEGISLWGLFLYCFVLCVPGDFILCVLGALLGERLIPLTEKYHSPVQN